MWILVYTIKRVFIKKHFITLLVAWYLLDTRLFIYYDNSPLVNNVIVLTQISSIRKFFFLVFLKLVVRIKKINFLNLEKEIILFEICTTKLD